MDVETIVKMFLKAFHFERAVWDGEELVCYYPKSNEPIVSSEYVYGSFIAECFDEMESLLRNRYCKEHVAIYLSDLEKQSNELI